MPPEDIGKYFVWLGFASVASVVATLRLDIAIFNAKSKKELTSIFLTALYSTVLILSAALILCIGIKYFSPGWTEKNLIKTGLFEALCMAAIMAANQTALATYVYHANFTKQAIAKIVLSGAVALAQLLTSLLGWGAKGLIQAHLISAAVVVVWIVYDVISSLSLRVDRFHPSRCFSTLKNNWRFPVFSMPADFIGSFAAQLPVFMVNGRFGSTSAGQYALTSRTLAAPVGLLAGAVLSVFKEEAAREYREVGNCRKTYLKTLKLLGVLGFPPFLILIFGSKLLFELIFGQEWIKAGELAQLLAPMFYLKFVVSPLSYTLYIANRQMADLLWQIVLLTMTATAFYLSKDIYLAVSTYSAGYSFLYLIYLLMSYKAAKGEKK